MARLRRRTWLSGVDVVVVVVVVVPPEVAPEELGTAVDDAWAPAWPDILCPDLNNISLTLSRLITY